MGGCSLVISVEAGRMLEERRILEDDVRQVLHRVAGGGRYLAHGEDGRRIAAAELGEVTFWVNTGTDRMATRCCVPGVIA